MGYFKENKVTLDFQQKQRERIREKYDYKCYFCNKSIKKIKKNSVHHICPKSLGGDWHIYNLVCLCDGCHKKLEKLNKRMLFRLLKLKQIQKYYGGVSSVESGEHERSIRLFNLKYKPNFKWFSLEVDNLFKKDIISQDALNKINELKLGLIERLNYNHELDINHIEVLKQRVQEVESKMKDMRAKKHFYRTKMNELISKRFKIENLPKEVINGLNSALEDVKEGRYVVVMK